MSKPSGKLTDKPDIIYISGAPGSGKSTLARLLGERMYSYTHIDPDDILQSFWEQNINNPEYDRTTVGVPRTQKVIEYLLASEVRIIIDAQPDEEFLRRLAGTYKLVNLHCDATSPSDRFYARELSAEGLAPDWLEAHMPEVRRLEESRREPLDFGQEIIRVTCDGSYEPSLDVLVGMLESKMSTS